MGRINVKRVLLGGLAAGATLFVLTGIVNGALLGSRFQAWAEGMGALLHPPGQPVQLALWAAMSLLLGTAGVWLYAGIRPRFGAGPRTALLAGLALWLVAKFAVALDFIALGLIPAPLVLGQVLGGLVAIPAGVLLGAWLYQE